MNRHANYGSRNNLGSVDVNGGVGLLKNLGLNLGGDGVGVGGNGL